MNVAEDQAVIQLIDMAKREDLGQGDATTALMDDPLAESTFQLVVKQPCVFSGREIAQVILEAYDESVEISWTSDGVDGTRIDTVPQVFATLRGPLGPMLSAERVLLNFLQRLCGIATLTRAFVDAVVDTQVAIHDTRKTIPGWRVLEKYAVRCGGGTNHRMNLTDAVLIKDNHLAGVHPDRFAAAIFDMLNRISASQTPTKFIEVEVDNLQQLESLLTVVGIDVILLDNFSPDDLRRAVSLRDSLSLQDKVALEASGGITLHNVRDIALTGVDHISVGAVTHSAPAIDLALERI